MLALSANKYTLLITPSQVKLMNGVGCMHTGHFISTIDFNINDINSLELAVRQSLGALTDRRANIYIRIGYPFIKTDVLSPSNSYLNYQERALRAKHLFELNYGEIEAGSEFRVDSAKYKTASVIECIDGRLLQSIKIIFNRNPLRLIEITSIHSWLMNTLYARFPTDALLFSQGDVYTYSLLDNKNIIYVAQFRCQVDHLANVFLQQIKKSLLITSRVEKLKKLLFLTEANHHNESRLYIETLKSAHSYMEINHMAGML